MSVKIIQKENKILRKIAEDVPSQKIGTSEIDQIIFDMKEAMHSQDDAVAIAAPQIGVSLRIFIVAGKVFKKKLSEEDLKDDTIPPDQVFINPKVLKLSKNTHQLEEGCLSVRYLYGKVKRAKQATIEALDENGNKVFRGASGLLAQIFQHETDHLNGVLFVDKATDLVDMPPEKRKKITK